MRRYGYDPNVDYSQKMNDAAAVGDYAAAARYEQQRNEKIRGEGLSYRTTNQYAQYLQKTDAEQMEDILAQLQNREPFSYDPEGDALYRQYRDQYREQGKLAMEDTVGQASALTGGYANSYAVTAGQQVYQDYLDRLNDTVPELYRLAYERYAGENDRLMQLYDLYADRDAQTQERLRAEQEDARDRAREERDNAYALALTMLQNGLMPSADLLSASGISEQDATALRDQANARTAAKSSSGGGSKSGGSKSTSSSKGKAVPLDARNRLADLYTEGGDSAIASSVAAYRAQGYDADELLQWIHTYFTYTPPDPWWQEGVDAANRNRLFAPWYG